MSRIDLLVDEFSRRSELAPATRDFYGWKLRRTLIPFCQREGLGRPEELTPEIIDEFAREMDGYRKANGEPLARASRRAYMTALKQFLSWLAKRHGIEGPDSRSVPMPSKRKVRRAVPNRDEIQTLEDAAPTERNKLIVRLLGDTGMRLGELVHLRRDALVAKGGRYWFLEIEGKTGRRAVPISSQLYRRLVAHRDGKSGRPKSSSPYLFLSRIHAAGYGPLTEKGVYQLVKDAAARSDLGRRVNPHLLRHAAITWMLAQGIPAPHVSEITGVSIAVIAGHYDHPTDEQLWSTLARAW